MENKVKSLNESIIAIRVELQNSKIKKSGKNTYAGFDYYELADFLPKLNELMLKESVNDIFKIENEEATLTLIKGSESQVYKMPFVLFETPINTKFDSKTGEVRQVKSMQDIQYLGALNTYYKRYLYLNAFGITDGEVIDSMNNEELDTKPVKKTAYAKVTPKQLEILNKTYTGENLTKLLEANKIAKLEDLPITKANELIKKIFESQKAKAPEEKPEEKVE